MKLSKVLTPKRIAKHFGVSEQTLLSWRGQGMPTVKIGKFILILEDDFLEWIEDLGNAQNAFEDSLKNLPEMQKRGVHPSKILNTFIDRDFLQKPAKSPNSYFKRFSWFGCFNPECQSGFKLETHHIIPRSRGGKDEFENYIILCFLCHRNSKNHSRYQDRMTILWTYKFYFESKAKELCDGNKMSLLQKGNSESENGSGKDHSEILQ